MRRQFRAGEVSVVMGDLNTKVGQGASGSVVENFGLGEKKRERR